MKHKKINKKSKVKKWQLSPTCQCAGLQESCQQFQLSPQMQQTRFDSIFRQKKSLPSQYVCGVCVRAVQLGECWVSYWKMPLRDSSVVRCRIPALSIYSSFIFWGFFLEKFRLCVGPFFEPFVTRHSRKELFFCATRTILSSICAAHVSQSVS